MSVVNDLDQRFVTLYPKAANYRHYIKISRYADVLLLHSTHTSAGT